MPRIEFRSIFCLLAAGVALAILSGTAMAGSSADCHRPPPAWYTAPRVSYTYTETYGSGYSRAPAREYAHAVRTGDPRRYRDRYAQW